MEDHGSPTLFSPEENPEEADVWSRFMAMGQAKGLEWAKVMVAAQGVQQSGNPALTSTNEVQPSDSGLCLLSDERGAAPAKRKRPARAAARSKLKRSKKDTADIELPEGPSTPQPDSGPRGPGKDNKEQEAAGGGGDPLAAVGVAPGASTPSAEDQTSQPAVYVACRPTIGAPGQGLQVGLGKMMEAMHSFMASAKAIAGLGADEQSASSRRAGAGQVWGQDTNGTPTAQGDASALGAGVADGVSLHTAAGGSDRANSVRPDPPLLSGRSSLAWRVPLEARERIWKREFIDIFSLLTFAKEGADITVPSKEVDKHKWKRKVKPEESIDNWLEAFAMLSTVIMEKFPEQGPALCKYNRVIYEEYTRNGGTGWLNYDREFRQKMEQAPEMAWDCREIELWVQYMGNGGRPASSDSAFTKHKQARPFYFRQHTLAHILKDYPRPSERVMLFRGFSEGFRIPYAGPSVTREANNLQSAKEAPGIVQEKLEMELQLGRVAGPFARPPLPNFIVSPLGIVPKKELGKYRMIHHLSYPKGASVNDYLEEGSCSVSYASFDEAVDLVRAAGIGALMAKADIESAFRLLPVHPGSFHLLGMKWAGQYFYDKCMPMGCAVSCSLFETFACFLEWALKEQKPPGSSLHYLDDFLFIGKAGSDECRATLNAFEHLSRALGVPLAPEKTQGPSECLTFLGIEIDSTSGICRGGRREVTSSVPTVATNDKDGVLRCGESETHAADAEDMAFLLQQGRTPRPCD
ncbi:hypothetical protein NDU88_013274 [Pleurodeles waltl]|uniref:ribonuclease H n=1 Tax=Pleurodeles waltl TaxID=8319 RepID=A0AAV7R401_PLEWA|nr:hypothetical protein NDU88_013274 [Pleurodeles waltl]